LSIGKGSDYQAKRRWEFAAKREIRRSVSSLGRFAGETKRARIIPESGIGTTTSGGKLSGKWIWNLRHGRQCLGIFLPMNGKAYASERPERIRLAGGDFVLRAETAILRVRTPAGDSRGGSFGGAPMNFVGGVIGTAISRRNAKEFAGFRCAKPAEKNSDGLIYKTPQDPGTNTAGAWGTLCS